MTGKAFHQGQICLHRGQLSQARAWFHQAVKESQQEGTWVDIASALGNLANICALLEEIHVAERGSETLFISDTAMRVKCLTEMINGYVKLPRRDFLEGQIAIEYSQCSMVVQRRETKTPRY